MNHSRLVGFTHNHKIRRLNGHPILIFDTKLNRAVVALVLGVILDYGNIASGILVLFK